MFNLEKTLSNKRNLFVFNYNGKDLKGLYHNGEITWFHPQPLTYLNKQHVNEVESKVHQEMINR